MARLCFLLVGSIGCRPSKRKINLDFGDQRRCSFLPDSWSEDKRATTIRNIGTAEPIDDDELFMYMQTTQIFQDRPVEKFSTGSKYLGQWNQLGIAGKGVYKYPHGVIYDGYFNRDGEFHGTGILVYPNGNRIEGMWKNGKLGPQCNFVAKGGVVMNKNYCLMPDRRFQVELENDFNPVGQEYQTDEQPPPREIPEGCYDLVEGFYDPSIKSVIDYCTQEHHDKQPRVTSSTQLEKKLSTKFLFSGDEERRHAYSQVLIRTESEKYLETLMGRSTYDENKIISWIPSPAQEEWIIRNCRKAWDEATGYRPDLYEEWTRGGRVYGDTGEPNLDSKCNLRTLNLHDDKESDYSGLVTFLRKEETAKENVIVDMLTKMFMKNMSIPGIGNGIISSHADLKMFSTSHLAFPSDDLLTLRRSK